MLIKSTEMGVYIKWALLLQEELQRSLTLHSQLQQMRGKLESENSELSMALGRPDPRPAASAEVASRGSSTPSALPSVAELQRLAGASGGGVFGQTPGTGGCMGSGVRHASPQVAPPTGKRTHAAHPPPPARPLPPSATLYPPRSPDTPRRPAQAVVRCGHPDVARALPFRL